MIKTIFDVLNSKKLTISVAESITGGALSKQLMSLAGSSSFFKGSVVTYSDESKIEILKIEKEKIRKHSAVSQQISALMASNVKNLFKSDIGFSTTGNAANFGSMTAARSAGGQSGFSNQTRAICVGGSPDTGANTVDTIDFITIAQTGSGIDFGNLSQARRKAASVSSSTRGVFAGGTNPSTPTTYLTSIESIIIATTGDAIFFGDLSIERERIGGGQISDSHGGLGGY